ncbi:MAG: polysaccharide biosynthesis/export family protein [Xanthobacteraceae bacterium]
MRLARLLLALLLLTATAGCAGMMSPLPPVASGDVPPPADLDGLLYGRVGGVAAVEPAVVVPVTAVIPAPPPVPAAVVPGPAPGGDFPYTLDSGDRLRIVVFGQDGLSNTYVVDVSGKIAIPLIGTVSARGCTTTQLARAIADRLKNGGYVREPHVAIEVEIYRPFFILGEVIAPGLYPYVPNMTVETAVAIAGGFTPRAFRWDAEISRSQSGVTSRQKVPLIAPVRPGDTVAIAERWF